MDLYAFQSHHLLLAFYKIYGFFLRGNLSSHQFSIFVPISDVDTPEPDEKSIITYVSQLYDVFPDPPPGHPLFDAEAQRKFEQFKELASSLHMWIREHITIMQVRYSARNKMLMQNRIIKRFIMPLTFSMYIRVEYHLITGI